MLPLWRPELSGEGDLGEANVHKGELLGVKGVLEGIGQLQRNFGLGEWVVQTVSKPAHYNKVDGGRQDGDPGCENPLRRRLLPTSARQLRVQEGQEAGDSGLFEAGQEHHRDGRVSHPQRQIRRIQLR